MSRKFPNTLGEAIVRIKQTDATVERLAKEGAAMQIERDEARATKQDAVDARRRAERDAEETLKQFADLKERLFNSEQETARLRGYLERVREDDNVADPLVEVDDQYGKRQVSKRHPSHPERHNGGSNYMEHFQGREKSKHWTSY